MGFSRELFRAAASFPVHFSVFYLLNLNFVYPKYPKSFQCGNLGRLEFPLSNFTQPECGLFRVQCDATPHPLVYLEDEGITSTREILSKISTHVFRIRNPTLEGVPAFVVVLFSTILFIFNRRKFVLNLKRKTQNHKDIELFLKNNENLAPRRYNYFDIKKMTKSFSDSLGEGGFARVYSGKLSDGRLVAVKILKESKDNGEEFINEVASISKTSHINIVTLLGFCFEGSKRALIYEFMPNGSLEKFICNNSFIAECHLGWEKLFQIAVSVAQGIEYLHQGCNTRILHFDIKPHNILLDKDFNPRILDFGLARLCPQQVQNSVNARC
ncbi:LEAF RUST 10 DISEASE-RESISTANCE LOCUS RECEPTOR-LIKE PROTEIN KINASE-like [Olea europaea subsp. europaea]|uniref:non-specific serine/threonine protein kinase n=1 Tax=Olea europaea subsp. europaea TaxID=158383 RepID=A0A8S0RAL9_OLEEU|nr:LEAF RUST 10 DISEASE-RESISTANCE LOCUS RECEPTOR-LIKE PROTEIN KINASE-like [Olea europaea subsp. europaea]